jgi:hypothetical protein
MVCSFQNDRMLSKLNLFLSVPSSTLYIPRYNRGKEGSSGLTRCLPIDCVKLYKATGAFVSYSGNILYSIYSTLLILSKVFKDHFWMKWLMTEGFVC